jgi:diaminohydroxyphosphoribosylaminopyrimidine deaminase/5-amino-6-(5-phosphoribosylamino)uracil reductase
MQAKIDRQFMRKALLLAGKVSGLTSPDPCVGAVIVKNNKIISCGYHDKFTAPHAEYFAIKKACKRARGANLYSNLQPCCHFGNNPPCTDLIIRSGIKRVAAAMKDPNPLVNGRGFKALKKAGIAVDVGLLEKEAKRLNEFFIKHITTGFPFVILKLAQTLDGKIATKTGDSRWISNEKSREYVHKIRSGVDAIMAGIGTILKDDPFLSARKGKRVIKEPYKIIIDPLAQIPLSAKVLKDTSKAIIVATKKAPLKKIGALKKLGVRVLLPATKEGKINLKYVFAAIGSENITSILIEGGGNTAADAIEQKVVDKVLFFIAPKIIGGKDAITPVEGHGIKDMKKAVRLKEVGFTRFDDDIMVEGYIK